MAVVKRLLHSKSSISEFSRKINIGYKAVSYWKKQYINRFRIEITEISIDEEIKMQLDNLIYKQEKSIETIKKESLSFVEVMAKEKTSSQYKDIEKQIIVETYMDVPVKEQGIWLRTNGFKSNHIELWQKEIIKMARKKIDQTAYISKLEMDVNRLQKDLKEAKKVQEELAIMFKLKKKFPSLFVNDEEANK